METTRFCPSTQLQPGDICAQTVRTPSGRTIAAGTPLSPADIQELRTLSGIRVRRTIDEATCAKAMPLALRAYFGQDVCSPVGQTLLQLRAQAEAERLLRGLPPLAPAAPRSAAITPPSLPPAVDLASFEPPELPASVQQLLGALAEDSVDAEKITRIVAQSPSLAGRLLKLVNSPAFGMPRRVDRIDRAVILVGARELGLLATSILLIEHFGVVSRAMVDMRTFFAHSIAVAAAARHLAQSAQPQMAETAFAAGLLHDMGRLLCLSIFPERAKVCLEWCRAHGRMVREVEAAFFGHEHASLGGAVLAAWNLPEPIVQAVAGHHAPQGFLAAVIHLADCLAHAAALGANGDPVPPRAHAQALELAHLSPETLMDAAGAAQANTDAFLAALT
ncbi:MAG: metal dependent phosphohydrolase [Desulfomicrobiaceae bacterium]|jgi:putative nucleotidyltransferase with HDIG domain|nr:metal dependent phosphohydrolase [Desulfomicrobiaceae bacterium]